MQRGDVWCERGCTVQKGLWDAERGVRSTEAAPFNFSEANCNSSANQMTHNLPDRVPRVHSMLDCLARGTA